METGGRAARFVAHVGRRFHGDRCLRVAASLSYTTILAIVPLMVIGFAMFSAFPVFEKVQGDIKDFLFRNMVPELGVVVREQFDNFVANTGQLTAVGILVLAVSALLMFLTVEGAFNVIWRVERPRPLVIRLVVFWAILTLGPLLMGASVVLSGYIFTLTRLLDVPAFTGPLGRLLRLLPFVLEIAVFSLLYVVLPSRRIAWRHALIGGAVAALLFEVLKKGFAYYVAHFPAQETIYGALSAVPLFLIWMYVAWAAVLMGAEVVAALPEYRRGASAPSGHGPGRLGVALALLAALADSNRAGEGGRTTARLRDDLGTDIGALDPVLARLGAARYVTTTADGRTILARDLDHVGLDDLLRDLGLEIGPEDIGDGIGEAAPWRAPAMALLDAARRARHKVLVTSLAALLDDNTRPEKPGQIREP